MGDLYLESQFAPKRTWNMTRTKDRYIDRSTHVLRYEWADSRYRQRDPGEEFIKQE